MKRLDLIRHLEAHGCVLLREGGSHSVDVNRTAAKTSTVPRHREINAFLDPATLRDVLPRPSLNAAAAKEKNGSSLRTELKATNADRDIYPRRSPRARRSTRPAIWITPPRP